MVVLLALLAQQNRSWYLYTWYVSRYYWLGTCAYRPKRTTVAAVRAKKSQESDHTHGRMPPLRPHVYTPPYPGLKNILVRFLRPVERACRHKIRVGRGALLGATWAQLGAEHDEKKIAYFHIQLWC